MLRYRPNSVMLNWINRIVWIIMKQTEGNFWQFCCFRHYFLSPFCTRFYVFSTRHETQWLWTVTVEWPVFVRSFAIFCETEQSWPKRRYSTGRKDTAVRKTYRPRMIFLWRSRRIWILRLIRIRITGFRNRVFPFCGMKQINCVSLATMMLSFRCLIVMQRSIMFIVQSRIYLHSIDIA